MKSLFALSIFLLLVVGCKKDDPVSPPPPPPSMSGKWSGAASGLTTSLTLSQSGNDVSGSATMTGTTSIAFTVSGTNVYPNVSLTISTAGYQPTNFTGRFSDNNTTPGKLNGSGFTDFSITLVRQ